MALTRWLKYKAARSLDGALKVLFSRSISSKRKDESLHPSVQGKYLLISLDHLGDAIMATPAIEAFKSALPESQLTVLTRPQNVPVFANNPYLDEVITDEAPWWSEQPVRKSLRPGYWFNWRQQIIRLRSEGYEAIIDLRGDLRHLLLFGAAANPRILLAFGKTGGERLLSAHVEDDPSMHEIVKKLALLTPLGITGIQPAPKIWLLPEEIAKARQFVAQLIGDVHSPVILMDPGAKPVQRWPLERYTHLAIMLSRLLQQPVLVSAGPLYSPLAEELVREAGEDSARSIGNIGLRDLMALVAACDLVISSDTGIAHIASAVGTRSVTLFGPTDPTRFWHGAPGSRVVQSPEPCCSEELHETCLKPSNPVPGFCMEMISELQVEESLAGALSDLLLPECIAHCQPGAHL